MGPNQANPEKLMLFLFPLITLSLFIAGIVVFKLVPMLFSGGQ